MVDIRLSSYYKPCPIDLAPQTLAATLVMDYHLPYEGLRQALIDEHGYEAFFDAQSKAFTMILRKQEPSHNF